MIRKNILVLLMGFLAGVTAHAAEQTVFETPESLLQNPDVVTLRNSQIPQSTLALVSRVHESTEGGQKTGQIKKSDIIKKATVGGQVIAFLTLVGDQALYPKNVEARWYRCGIEVAKYPLALRPQNNPHRVWFWIEAIDLGAGPASVELRSVDDKQVLAQIPFEVTNMNGQSVACPPAVHRATFSTDDWFGYGRFSLPDVSDQGKRELSAFVQQIGERYSKINTITVTGHTDIIGPESANDRLSKARANTVRQMLIQAGIAEALIQSDGKGELEPLVECASTLTREQLIACAQPNRRFTIDIDGVEKE